MNTNKKTDISEAVRSFYEKYPYPGPVESLDKYKLQWQDPQRKRADYHLYWPDRSYREDLSILIAGCGTSQAAKHAIRNPNARVTGIDFSSKSISFTEKLKKKYDLDNLKVVKLSIENVKELEMSFDRIVCTGVLHHLPDPDAGLKALREVLNPDGAMHLMVYAPYGRAGIYMMQKFCKLLGIRADEDGIHDLIRSIKGLPPGHPLETLIRNAPDFQYEEALADALLNPMDRAYTVPQLFEFINNAGLKFFRWIRQAMYSSRCGVMSQIPQSEKLQQLSSEEQYAAAELFRGTMVRHSMIAYRNDNPDDPGKLSFENENCQNYIPIRMPDTLCIKEQLPEGAAAILINKTQYRDIYLPVNTTEKLMFEAIDGISSIGIISKKILQLPDMQTLPEISRNFFEKLWWYDQVVFDTTNSGF